MTTETLILMHLMVHSSQKPGQIAEAVGRSLTTVRSSLVAMVATGDVWHDAEARYSAAEPVGDADSQFVILCEKATKLQERNLWYRAARVWLEAHDATSRPGLRQKAIICRARCISRGNFLAPKPEPDFPEKRRRRQ
ncbi:MarR family transcriptional regulator [Pantoea sp. Mb-10]|uniref:MarR family transcriptional regulator n=1 Tax=unclassified Pantoea TaxID=2630326 RepID=UPI001E51EF50|nr:MULTISPECIES: MarR family transcriptional regulator [unclassified Pantoea]MCE0490969.1 MarR family transcriptional regulator [Pantoea sp. Mb-10]MCE0499873.1 MarR family transcriptional regulator [Pantoea sp. Pb-8]